MKGDFSRQTFRPEKHYSGVRLQQGRAHLDADWNEQIDIQAHRDATMASDVIGAVGAPFEDGGFAVSGASFLRGIALVDADRAWAVGERGAILHTTDKGASWTTQAAPAATGDLDAVQAVTANSVWAVGEGGTLLHHDGSAWTRVPVTGVTAALHGLDIFDATHGWAVGDAGTVLFWDGSSWSQRNVPQLTAALRGVHFVSAVKGWAVGDGGTIVSTSDGGATWNAQSAPVGTPRLHSVFFTGANAGAAVGDGGTILATADGGATWERRAMSGVSSALRAVRFESAGQNGWAAGHDATLVATTDGGATWVREDTTGAGLAHMTGLALFGGTRLACGGPLVLRREAGPTRWMPRPLPARGRDLLISAGDLYVDGVRCENDRVVSFTSQPDLPGVLPGAPGSGSELRGAYLARCEEHLTAVQREEIREVALRGPDTSTRTRVSWQVRLTDPLADDRCATLAAELPSAGGAGRLRARAEPVEVTASECSVAPAGGYRRLENQLYRVEIHDSGPIDPGAANGHATYKWSRDNGSMLARLEELDESGPSVTVSTTGRDDVLGFAAEQWVEVTDESRSRRGLPGILLEVDRVEGKSLVLVSFPAKPGGGSWSMADFPLNPTVRRWDGQAPVPVGWEELEDGVQVEFGSGPFETGNFWTVPARTVTGDVDWPQNGVPEFRTPQGGPVGFAALGVVRAHANGDWEGVRDCRRRFPTLTSLATLYYVGGDGQEAMPDPTVLSGQAQRLKLDQPLQVGVSNWRWPVESASVQFERVVGGGSLGGPTDTKVVVVTDEDGIARCDWYLDGTTQSQTVEATLLDENGSPVQTPVRFNASLSRATHVAYDPSDCQNLLEAGAKTVQAAVSRLAGQPRMIEVGGDAQETLPGETLDEIQVRVENSCGPLEGAKVRFTVVGGDGTLSGGSGTPHAVDLATDGNGKAGAAWTLGPDAATQYVEAQLLDDGTGATLMPPPPVVMFSANLSRAEHVAYTPPERCRGLEATTVQEALDELCVPPFGAFAHLDGHGAGTLLESHNVASFSKAGAEPGRYSFVWERPLSPTAPLLVFAYARAWPGGRFPLLAAIAERKQTGLTVQVSRTSDYYTSTAPADGFVALAVLGGIPDTLPPEPAPPMIVKATQSLPIGSWVTDFATADLDRSGLPDLIVAAGNGIHAFVNRGDGQFDEAGIVGTANVSRLAVADVNDDGIPDLVCATYSNSVTIYYGAGNGTFGDPFTVEVGANVYSLSVGALTGPGRADIATLGSDGKVRILATNVDGNFEVARELETGVSSYNGDVLAAGVGDNLADVLVTYPGANKVAVFRRRANLEFTNPDLIDVADGPNRLGAGDLTGNGALDFVVLCQNDLAVLLSGPGGRLSDPARYFAGYFPNSIAIADVGDGNPDLIVGSHEVAGVLPATAPGKFRDPVPVFTPFGTGPQRVVAADFNGDGRMDIAAVADGANMLNILTSE